MTKESLYGSLRVGRITAYGKSEKPAPSHSEYKFNRNPYDLHFPRVILELTQSPEAHLLKDRIAKIFRLRRVVAAQALLPPHMQLEYGFGKRAQLTDCYGAAILFNRSDYQPQLGQDRNTLITEFEQISEDDAKTGDLWELYNSYTRVTGFDLITGERQKEDINHCAVILTIDGLVCSKNGSGLLAGLFVSSRGRIFALYENLRQQQEIETEYENRFWRDPRV